MIKKLLAKVDELFEDRAYLTIGPITFEVIITDFTRIKLKKGEERLFYTHLIIQENKISVFASIDKNELELFSLLIDTQSIGVMIARNMLSVFTPADLFSVIQNEDAKELSKVPKIGIKKAKVIIANLKGKLPKLVADETDDLIEVLKSLGFKLEEISAILHKIPKNKELEERIKIALTLLR